RGPGECDFRRSCRAVALLQETQARVLVAAVPQAVEIRGKVIEEEGHAMRLVSAGGDLDQSRPFGDLPGQRQLCLVAEAREIRARERGVAHVGAGLDRLAQD